jgi:hypothetical protein
MVQVMDSTMADRRLPNMQQALDFRRWMVPSMYAQHCRCVLTTGFHAAATEHHGTVNIRVLRVAAVHDLAECHTTPQKAQSGGWGKLDNRPLGQRHGQPLQTS